MKIPLGRRVALAFMAVVFAGAGVSAVTAAGTPTVALRLADLPSGYKLTSAGQVSNAQMAVKTKVPRAQFDKHGRVGGYEQQFDGAASVFANIYRYKTPAGALWDFTESVAHDSTGARKIAAPKIGDGTVGFSASGTSAGKKLAVYVVDFHRGGYDITVGVIASVGHVHLADAVHYARILNGRITG